MATLLLQLVERPTVAPPSFPPGGYIPAFDGLRALSILGVFAAHSEFLRALPHASVLEYGRLGVDLFFVLSGFLITGILLDSRGTPHFLRNFYARRALRIWPLYYLVLAILFVIAPLAIPFLNAPALRVWPFYFLYLQNLPSWFSMPLWLQPTWSLAIEEQFYVVWPLAIKFLERRAVAVLLAGCIVASIASRLILHSYGFPLRFVNSFTLSRLDGLALGSLAAVWLRSPSCNFALWKRSAWLFIILGSVGPLVMRPILGQQRSIADYTFVAVAFCGLLGLAFVSDPKTSSLGRFLGSGVLRGVGRISYGLYLLHMPVFLTVKYLAKTYGLDSGSVVSNALLAAAQFSLVFAVASVSWLLFEKPILRLKTKFPSASQLHWPKL